MKCGGVGSSCGGLWWCSCRVVGCVVLVVGLCGGPVSFLTDEEEASLEPPRTTNVNFLAFHLSRDDYCYRHTFSG